MHTVTIRKRYTIIIKNGVTRYVNESQIELSIINWITLVYSLKHNWGKTN